MKPKIQATDADNNQQNMKRKAKGDDLSPMILLKKQKPDKTAAIKSEGDEIPPSKCRNIRSEIPSGSILDVSGTWTSGSEEETTVRGSSSSRAERNHLFDHGKHVARVEALSKALNAFSSSSLSDLQASSPPMLPPQIFPRTQKANSEINGKVAKEIDTGSTVAPGSMLWMQRPSAKSQMRSDMTDTRPQALQQGVRGTMFDCQATRKLSLQTNNTSPVTMQQHSQSPHKNTSVDATAESTSPPQNQRVIRHPQHQNNEQHRKKYDSFPQTRDIGKLVAFGVGLRVANDMAAERMVRERKGQQQAQHDQHTVSDTFNQTRTPTSEPRKKPVKSDCEMESKAQHLAIKNTQQPIDRTQAGNSPSNNRASLHHPLQVHGCPNKVKEISDAEAQLIADNMAFMPVRAQHGKAYFQQTQQQNLEVSRSNRRFRNSLTSAAFGLDGASNSPSPPTPGAHDSEIPTEIEALHGLESPKRISEESEDELTKIKEREKLELEKRMEQKRAERAAKEREVKKYTLTKLGDHKGLDDIPSMALPIGDPDREEFDAFDASVLAFEIGVAMTIIETKPKREPNDGKVYAGLKAQLKQLKHLRKEI